MTAATEYFLYRLIPPRPTFAQDMDAAEAATMGEHAGYWMQLVQERTAVVFGPVMDPGGTWGLAIVEAADEAAVRRIGELDPAVSSGVACFEVCPMPQTTVRA